jgi:uncharacterized protein (DUF2384 family)
MALIDENLAAFPTRAALAARRIGAADGIASVERQVSTIRTMAGLSQFVPEWKEFLTRGAYGATFHNDPANVELALVNDEGLSPLFVVVRRQGHIECLAPFYINRTRFRLKLSVLTLASLPIRLLKLFGDRIIYSKDCLPRESFEAVFVELRQHLKLFDLVYLYNLDCSEPLWNACAELSSRRAPFQAMLASAGIEKVHQVQITSTHEAFLASLTSSTRQELRRKTRRLLSDNHGKLVKVTRPEQVAEFLEKLDVVFRNSWQAKTFGYRPRNTQAQRQRFEVIASRGWLRSYLLVQDGQPIAFELGYQYGGQYYGEECGFDPSRAQLGPGAVLMHLVIEDLFKEDRPKLMDFGFGEAAYKRSLGNIAHDAASLYLAPPNGWRHLLRLQRVLNFLDVRVRPLLVRSRLDRLVRRLLKHKK